MKTKYISYKIEHDEKTTISGEWHDAGVKFTCEILPTDGGNNGDGFTLKFEGGQIYLEEGDLKMYGLHERRGFKEMLKIIIRYL